MRVVRWGVAGVAVMLGVMALAQAGSPLAQAGSPGALTVEGGDPLAALQNGRLVVWVVGAARPAKTGFEVVADLNKQTPLNYQEQTAGGFGQAAGTYGQSAGSYGVSSDAAVIGTVRPTSNRDPAADSKSPEYQEQTAGSFGQNSGGFGTAASAHGRTSGSVGQAASSYGTSSSNYGQTASSLTENGGTASDLSNKIRQAKESMPNPLSDAVRVYLQPRLERRFAGVEVEYSDVYADELQARLKETQGTAASPDVLMGPVPVAWMLDERSRMVVGSLRPAVFYDDGLGSAGTAGAKVFRSQVTIVAGAPHMAAARAFALWMSEADGCDGCVYTGTEGPGKVVAAVAQKAVERILRGESLGELADREMAAMPLQLGRPMMSLTTGAAADGVPVRVEAMQSSVNGRLAVVELRVVASSESMYGLAHPLVVLRQGSRDGQWRVLHVSLNLPVAEQQGEYDALRSEDAAGDGHAALAGVSLAAPVDGDKRPPMPELWWNNGGGAGLQVVEWQRCFGVGCTEARLFLVSDRGARLQTRVTAKFAGSEGQYRWRVWSVGAGGETKMTPWWKLTIVR